ncbi:CBS domain-containing protein [Halalkalicoccus salilacus]|uniref:CBS domain-containing protein n=1 Tax=Halalkalicoccus salilacus TaxID=3117459 RepID=UPI00300E7BF8
MPVLDPAREDVVPVERDAEVTEISETMNDERVGSVVVENGEPVGIVTDRTVALAVGQEDDVNSLVAEDLMSEDPATVSADTEADELATEFGDAKVPGCRSSTRTASSRGSSRSTT